MVGIGFGFLGGLLSTLLFFVNLKKEFSVIGLILGFVTVALLFGLSFGLSVLISKVMNKISIGAVEFNQDLLLLNGGGYLVSVTVAVVYLILFS